jgi:hypothetical protein
VEDEKNAPTETGVEESNPNAAGLQGLRGDMGVSSERTGPRGGPEEQPASEGVQGTGIRGTAATSTEGTVSTSGGEEDGDDDETRDQTFGERNTAEVPSHDFDPSRNPGHSHG